MEALVQQLAGHQCPSNSYPVAELRALAKREHQVAMGRDLPRAIVGNQSARVQRLLQASRVDLRTASADWSENELEPNLDCVRVHECDADDHGQKEDVLEQSSFLCVLRDFVSCG